MSDVIALLNVNRDAGDLDTGQSHDLQGQYEGESSDCVTDSSQNMEGEYEESDE